MGQKNQDFYNHKSWDKQFSKMMRKKILESVYCLIQIYFRQLCAAMMS